MFCDGKCKIEKEVEEGTVVKQCGLLITTHLENKKSGEVKIEEKCALLAMLESMMRREHHDVGMQAAFESGRNESAKWGREQNKTLAQGFLGLIHTVNENTEATKKVKYLGDVMEAEIVEEEVELLEKE